MTDLHTHILPGMDDGASNLAVSVAMLLEERRQGVDTVVLTPHFYRDIESPGSFLKRRGKAMQQLATAMAAYERRDRANYPELKLGAEVAWVLNMSQWSELDRLCYEGTDMILVEPPVQPWTQSLFRDLYGIIDRGLTPVIAHIDRYWDRQEPEKLRQLCSMGIPIQISAECFLSWGPRGKALNYLKKGMASLLISDCHNLSNRRPNLGQAMKFVQAKLGDRAAQALFDSTDDLLAPPVKF